MPKVTFKLYSKLIPPKGKRILHLSQGTLPPFLPFTYIERDSIPPNHNIILFKKKNHNIILLAPQLHTITTT